MQGNGTISVTPVQVPGAQYYGLSAFYTRQLLGREVKAWSARPQNIFQNGSVAVDHFSAAGAKVITDFLEDYVLDDESKQLFKDVGHLFWEDSVEIDGDLYWTPGLEKKFLEMYKVRICLSWSSNSAKVGYYDLTKAGYSYEYLSPANFVLEEAVVQDRVFAPTRQAAKLLVLRSNDTITPDGVTYLAKYAAAGLPIIIYGTLPSQWATANKTAISASSATLKGLLELPNVHQIPEKDLAAAVASIGIKPRTQISSNGTWWTRWRETTDGETFVFIYNDNNAASTGNITFAVAGTPYLLNAWTGEEGPIVQYVAGNDSTTISLSLKGLETAIVRFSKNNTLNTHVVASSGSVLGFRVPNNGSQILAKVAHSNTSSVRLSTGKTVVVSESLVQPTWTLGNWTLTLEHWLPQEDLYDLEPDAKKVNYSVPITSPSLKSWYDLGYQTVSGIGYYSTKFQWTPSSDNDGAQLSIPPVSHGLVGTLNGKALPAFDITNPVVDISSALINGTNTLQLKASSTLMNTLSQYWSELRTFGVPPANNWAHFEKEGLGYQQNGIIGEVKIVPYALVQVV